LAFITGKLLPLSKSHISKQFPAWGSHPVQWRPAAQKKIYSHISCSLPKEYLYKIKFNNHHIPEQHFSGLYPTKK